MRRRNDARDGRARRRAIAVAASGVLVAGLLMAIPAASAHARVGDEAPVVEVELEPHTEVRITCSEADEASAAETEAPAAVRVTGEAAAAVVTCPGGAIDAVLIDDATASSAPGRPPEGGLRFDLLLAGVSAALVGMWALAVRRRGRV